MAIDPARFDMPDATTTGVQSGVTLTNYTGPMTIKTAGTVIESKIINGTMTVNADNVTFKNCVFQNFSNYGIISENSDNTHVEFCEFDGTGSSRTYAMALGGGTSSIISCDIHGMVIAIGVWGTVNISDNYIHDLAEASSDPDARHFDGINLFAGGNGTVIDHNTIAMPGTNTGGGTAAVFISAQFGNINDVTVSNNLLYGGASYTVYVEETRGYQITNVSLTDNYVEKGQYGYYNIVGNTPVMSGNVTWWEGVDPTPYPTGPVDHFPDAVNDAVSTGHDVSVTFNALANDVLGDTPTAIAAFAAVTAHGTVALGADGRFTYDPAADWSGVRLVHLHHPRRGWRH